MSNKFVFLFCRYALVSVLLTVMLPACNVKDKEKEKDMPRVVADLYLREGKFDEAEAALKKAIKTDPANISSYTDLSLLYLAEGNYEDAEKQALAGLKIEAKNTDLMIILSEAYIKKGRNEEAEKQLKEILVLDSKNISAYYKLSKLAAAENNAAGQESYLLRVLDFSPANIVVRLQLAGLLAATGKADSSRFYLQSVKKIAAEFPLSVDSIYKKAEAALQGNKLPTAITYISRFSKLMEITRIYSISLHEIELPNTVVGFFEFNDSQFSHHQANNENLLGEMSFTDASASIGLTIPNVVNAVHSVVTVTGYDGSNSSFIYASFFMAGHSSSIHSLFSVGFGNLKDITAAAGISDEGEELDAAFADYDNDGNQDLFISTTKGIIVYRNDGDETFSRIKKNIGLNEIADGNKLLIADYDQDGDLDLYVGSGTINRFFRNNGDGTFTEQAAAMNLVSNRSGTTGIDFGDWDSDGDLDIAALPTNGTVELFNNNRHSKFEELSDSLQLRDPAFKGAVIAFGDYNNDGMPDLFIAGTAPVLLKNTGAHGFVADPFSSSFSTALKNVVVSDVAFIDFDNDGREDILVAGVNQDHSSRGLLLFHNDSTKGFSNVSQLLPAGVTQATRIAIADFNLDGDDDIFLAGPSGVFLLRNDGGSANHFMQVELKGLSYGNNKNNRLGIGAQVELKAGDLYQLKTIRRGLVNFGVGARDSLDAVRIIWPNGTPQYIGDPSKKQKSLEEEKLKGSCPFLFTWNGKQYEFVKDMMWRSALGMPLAIHGKDTVYAFSDPSKEYLLIPGEKLQPKDGKYSIKITEELWEAVYFDKAGLVAVDHPDTVAVFADERFVAPPFPGKKVYPVTHKYFPVNATDDNGNNLLPTLNTYDFQYVSTFSPGRFQGLTEQHELMLDLGDEAINSSLYLFLRGWTFPSDASINTSMAQSDVYRVQPPTLQVINKKGEWQTVIPNIGFPMGKDKMVIVNLTGKFLTQKDRRVRIITNMQIYWDEIFFSPGHQASPLNIHDLTMVNATLSFRGYSDSYRKEGPFGPLWFDYYKTSQGQKWRDLTGNYTRYGNVLPLLLKADDEYIIANSGDEMAIDFDAQSLPALPAGWKRDFLIYSEGWVKDGDLNTAYGQTVEPLPFHNMSSYPYGANTAYPSLQHKSYLREYNTRSITTDDFKNALKQKSLTKTREKK